jgi:uncharacterized protein YdhG (YjbR/CyaY superfamily)
MSSEARRCSAMGERKPAAKKAQRSPKRKGLTEGEQAAMKERLRELQAEERTTKNRAEGERALLEAIDAMSGPDRTLAKRIHAIVEATAPNLWPKTWYGMPAYAKDGKVVCFFKSAAKFKSRYATFGFEEAANLDDGAMWPVAFALKTLTAADEKKIAALVKKAAT